MLTNDVRAAPAGTGRGPQNDRLGETIERNDNYFLTGKASPIRDRDWWAREAEREGFDMAAVVDAALDIIATTMFETDFERACRRAEVQRRPAPRPAVLRVPETTIEAILYCVRERGLAALREPANQVRLRAINADPTAKKIINERIARLNVERAHAA